MVIAQELRTQGSKGDRNREDSSGEWPQTSQKMMMEEEEEQNKITEELQVKKRTEEDEV